MKFLLRGFIFLAIVLMYGISSACCTPETIEIHGVNVVLMVNGDGTITAIYNAQYRGEENGTGWSWLLPVPGEIIEVRQACKDLSMRRSAVLLNHCVCARDCKFLMDLDLAAEAPIFLRRWPRMTLLKILLSGFRNGSCSLKRRKP